MKTAFPSPWTKRQRAKHTYRHHDGFHPEPTARQYFLATPSKDKRVANFQANHVFALIERLVHPPVDLFLREIGAAGQFAGHFAVADRDDLQEFPATRGGRQSRAYCCRCRSAVSNRCVLTVSRSGSPGPDPTRVTRPPLGRVCASLRRVQHVGGAARGGGTADPRSRECPIRCCRFCCWKRLRPRGRILLSRATKDLCGSSSSCGSGGGGHQ